MTSFSLNTSTSPGYDLEHFSIIVSGSITNHSDREITHMRVWCRAEAVQGSETESRWIAISLKSGETKAFAGQIADQFSGIAGPGHILRGPPKRHFCRLTKLAEK
jgi:hypothetical protein